MGVVSLLVNCFYNELQKKTTRGGAALKTMVVDVGIVVERTVWWRGTLCVAVLLDGDDVGTTVWWRGTLCVAVLLAGDEVGTASSCHLEKPIGTT